MCACVCGGVATLAVLPLSLVDAAIMADEEIQTHKGRWPPQFLCGLSFEKARARAVHTDLHRLTSNCFDFHTFFCQVVECCQI